MTHSTLPPIRRIVTGHDENNKACALWDGTDLLTRRGPAGNSSTAIWCSDSAPADNAIGTDIEDMGQPCARHSAARPRHARHHQ